MHRPPYSSSSTHPSDPTLQWDFSGFGLDLLIAAHAHSYERLSVDGIPHIVVGTGGRSLYGFGAAIAESVIRVPNKFGRLIGNANCDQLKLDFKDVDGNVLDTITLTKP